MIYLFFFDGSILHIANYMHMYRRRRFVVLCLDITTCDSFDRHSHQSSSAFNQILYLSLHFFLFVSFCFILISSLYQSHIKSSIHYNQIESVFFCVPFYFVIYVAALQNSLTFSLVLSHSCYLNWNVFVEFHATIIYLSLRIKTPILAGWLSDWLNGVSVYVCVKKHSEPKYQYG